MPPPSPIIFQNRPMTKKRSAENRAVLHYSCNRSSLCCYNKAGLMSSFEDVFLHPSGFVGQDLFQVPRIRHCTQAVNQTDRSPSVLRTPPNVFPDNPEAAPALRSQQTQMGCFRCIQAYISAKPVTNLLQLSINNLHFCKLCFSTPVFGGNITYSWVNAY